MQNTSYLEHGICNDGRKKPYNQSVRNLNTALTEKQSIMCPSSRGSVALVWFGKPHLLPLHSLDHVEVGKVLVSKVLPLLVGLLALEKVPHVDANECP